MSKEQFNIDGESLLKAISIIQGNDVKTLREKLGPTDWLIIKSLVRESERNAVEEFAGKLEKECYIVWPNEYRPALTELNRVIRRLLPLEGSSS